MRVLLFLVFLVLGGAAQAATYEADPSDLCFFKMSGEIAPNELERFADAADRFILKRDDWALPQNRVCLDSPGGSLAAAVKIGEYLADNGFGTVVDAGDRCLSACSVMFMMGTMGGYEAGGVNRILHVQGRLGFHRPSLSLPAGNYDNDTVIQAFGLALDATADFVSMANRVPNNSKIPMIPADLIREMYSHEGEDFFYIDRVDHVGRWGIQPTGFQPPKDIGPQEAFYACNNLSVWPARLMGDPLGYAASAVKAIANPQGSRKTWSVAGNLQSDGIHECGIGVSERAPSLLLACGRSDKTDVTVNDQFCNPSAPGEVGQPQYAVFGMERAIYPAETRLKDLPALARQIEARAKPVARPKDSDNGFRNSCGYKAGTQAFVTNVNNFVNVRSDVGFDKPIATEARRDARVTLTSARTLLFGDRTVRPRCQQTCQALRQSNTARTRRLVNQCFEDNALWFKIRVGGVEGYVSGKFLRF